MLYRHTLRFQRILQRGLVYHIINDRMSEAKILKKAKINCSKSTLNRFRNAELGSLHAGRTDEIDKPISGNAGVYLNAAYADRLWRYLHSELVFERMVDHQDMSILGLFSREVVGDAIQGFYGVKSSESKSFKTAGLSGPFFCYKPSFRREGFTVKSRMEFVDTEHGFFLVDEKQITTGDFEMDRSPIVEKSTGFGFIKSGRLWIFMRDVESEQPRIFCFHRPKFSKTNGSDSFENNSSIPTNQTVYSWFGYLIEGVKGNQDSAFNFRVVLNAEDNERETWAKKFKKKASSFIPERQLEVLPTAERQTKLYKDQLKTLEIDVPIEVLEYFESGTITDVTSF